MARPRQKDVTPALIPAAVEAVSKPVRPAIETSPFGVPPFDVASIVWPGASVNLSAKGLHVSGIVTLDTPNPRGRRRLTVNVLVGRTANYWTPMRNAAALRVAIRWFADIGGFSQLMRVQLAHVVALMKDGIPELSLQAAVGAYAASTWHRKQAAMGQYRWMSLGRFFMGDKWQACLDASPEHADELKKQRHENADQADRDRIAARQAEAVERRARNRAARHKPLATLDDETLKARHRVATIRRTDDTYGNTVRDITAEMQRRGLLPTEPDRPKLTRDQQIAALKSRVNGGEATP